MNADAPARLWLIRHAPAEGADSVVCGRLDLPAVSPMPGEIDALAEKLPRNAVWYASSLRRSRETVAALRAARAFAVADVLIDDDLIEQNFGDWEGQDKNTVYAGIHEDDWKRASRIKPPKGESFAQVYVRASAAIGRIARSHAGQDIIAVIHAGPIRAAVAHTVGGDAEAALKIGVDTLSLTRLDFYEDRQGGGDWAIGFVNKLPQELG